MKTLELDHFEPENIDESKRDEYFHPKDTDSRQRKQYVNELGNFMLLDRPSNSRLGNKPAKESFKAYQEVGLGDHWLVKELGEMLQELGEREVPTERFFSERKKKLQQYFLTILDMGLGDTRVKIRSAT